MEKGFIAKNSRITIHGLKATRFQELGEDLANSLPNCGKNESCGK